DPLMEAREFDRSNKRNVEHRMQTGEQGQPPGLDRKRCGLMCQLFHKTPQLGFIIMASNLIGNMRIGKHLGELTNAKIVGQFSPEIFYRFRGVFVKKGNYSMHRKE